MAYLADYGISDVHLVRAKEGRMRRGEIFSIISYFQIEWKYDMRIFYLEIKDENEIYFFLMNPITGRPGKSCKSSSSGITTAIQCNQNSGI